jgi:D-3-phosphoglycerate dehydrogenase
MPATVVIACLDTRNPPDRIDAFANGDFVVRRILGMTSPEAYAEFREADGLIVELQTISAEMIADLKRCRVIACASTGFDYVDGGAAARRGIWVTHVPGYCTDEVATHTLALLLSQARRLPQLQKSVRAGEWDPRPVRPLNHVRGRTLGVLGYGRIGTAVAAKTAALGFRVVACDPYVDQEAMRAAGVRPVDLETLLRESDYLSLHVPLTEETRGLLDAQALALLKPQAYLINTARGAVVDEAALVEAVRSGRLAGAAIDVLASEPPPPDHPFLHDDRFTVTPHSAWCSEEADREVWERSASDVARVLRGERPNWPANQLP